LRRGIRDSILGKLFDQLFEINWIRLLRGHFYDIAS
jgi:hypothetical protein